MMKKIGLALLIILGFVFITPPVAQADIMACMEKCIRDNGKDEKATCKSSCAGSIGSMSRKPVDCGTIYKKCRKSCDKKDKACKSACKDAQRSCY
ncbi:MAG: hypothetical protein OQJ97_10765 [Rhodospirillales bacterium]|nr:hypothetical protein [Rhodospirillales bacterium]